jgi:hypothetical protein
VNHIKIVVRLLSDILSRVEILVVGYTAGNSAVLRVDAIHKVITICISRVQASWLNWRHRLRWWWWWRRRGGNWKTVVSGYSFTIEILNIPGIGENTAWFPSLVKIPEIH